MRKKKILGVAFMGLCATLGLVSCGSKGSTAPQEPQIINVKGEKGDKGEKGTDGLTPYIGYNGNWWIGDEDTGALAREAEVKTPKYVFMFIGDGMTYPQLQATSYYLGAMNQGLDNGDKTNKIGMAGGQKLSFMDFDTVGTATTYDATSFAPDSASTATSLATGQKTWSGSINVSLDFTEKYETIAEKLKKQKDYKVGIVTSVNLNHATPAAFYAHNQSRNNYFELGQELISSDFDYFAGGAFLGRTKNGQDLHTLAEEAGYNVVTTQAEAATLKSGDKAIVIAENQADSGSLSYEIDRKEGEWALADYVSKGIDVLDNEKGFFMMVEGGKIDWACHANDAATSIKDTEALSNAVDEAIKFYNKHPEDTLILVTGDHETGGLSLGYAGTDYDTYFTNLSNQKISFKKYDDDYVSKYKTNNTSFNDVLKDVEELFGLVTQANATSTTKKQLILTAEELAKLEESYKQTMKTSTSAMSQAEKKINYGSYTPLSVTITHLLNNKSGIAFTSYSHTGLPTAVFALGATSSLFDGYYDNTDIYKRIAALVEVE